MTANFHRHLSRRNILRNAFSTASLFSLAACGRQTASLVFGSSLSGPQRRLAVIGGGIGGVATAYLCDADWRVEVFESGQNIGGHCSSETINYRGEGLTVDFGAQFFHPDTHTFYVALLEELGIYDANAKDRDEVIEAPASLSIQPLDSAEPYFVSSHPLRYPSFAIDFAVLTRALRSLIVGDAPYEMTLHEWVSSLHVRESFKERILKPWISSLIGTTQDLAMTTSARSIVQTFALSFPQCIFQTAWTLNSKIGLQGNLERMLASCHNTVVHTASPVLNLEKSQGAWYLQTPSGRHGPFDQVVVNAQPLHSKKFLGALAGAAPIVSLLEKFHYFDTRIAIHEDPIYAPQDRQNWSLYNAGIENGSCEGSIWLGALHKTSDGKPVELFKSWTSRRTQEPQKIIGERLFQHPLTTPDVIRASRQLGYRQGDEGLWFAGNFMTGVDLQDSALYSAMQVAKSLSPDSRNLQAIQARVSAKGRANLNYDL